MTVKQLKIDLAMAGDVIECCKVLLNYCLTDENTLTDSQLETIIDMFGEQEIASHALMYVYSMGVEEDSSDYEKTGNTLVDELFKIMYDKFLKEAGKTPIFSAIKNINA